MNTALPSLVTEIHRHPDPWYPRLEDAWGFIALEPDTKKEWSIYPFSKKIDFADVAQRTDKSLRGPNYRNPTPPRLYGEEKAKQERIQLHKDGYRPIGLGDPAVPPDFRHYVIRSQAPLEWQKSLNNGEDEFAVRIIVWIKGDFPGQDHQADLASLREKILSERLS